MNTFQYPDGSLHIELESTSKWEIVVTPEGTIALACVHQAGPDPEDQDRFMLGLGHMECAGLPAAEMLMQGIGIIQSGGFVPGTSTN